MSFRENLERKIEVGRLAYQVIASCGSAQVRRPIDKEAMRRLLMLSPYRYQRERDLDLYIKETVGELQLILVLDNELPIFRSTVKDVVVRRSPRTLDLWNIRTIRRILVDSDIKESVYGASVATVQRDAIAQLDLVYTEADIAKLAVDGVAALAEGDANGVAKILALFAELLGYRHPPKSCGLDQKVCYGLAVSGPGHDEAFGPLVLYRPADNILTWIEEPLSQSDTQQMEFLRAVAAGETSVPVTGYAVMHKLQEQVLGRSGYGVMEPFHPVVS